MCEPTTLTMLGIAIVGAFAANDQQRASSNRAADATKAQNDLVQNDLARQTEQQDAAGRAQMNDANRKALHDSALFDAVAGEYGGGNSVDRARAVGGLQQSEQLATIASNTRTAQGETAFQSLATMVNAQGRLNSLQYPSWIGTGLQIAGAGANAYAQHDQLTRAPKPTTKTPLT
jgi:hypothetical protein